MKNIKVIINKLHKSKLPLIMPSTNPFFVVFLPFLNDKQKNNDIFTINDIRFVI